MAVYEILTALEPVLPEEEIQKHVHSTQYQFRVFENVDCFMSLCRRYLDKAVMLLFLFTTSGVATHWILWINPGAARCWWAAKCDDNVLNEQRQSH